jgi:hypothetical protein
MPVRPDVPPTVDVPDNVVIPASQMPAQPPSPAPAKAPPVRAKRKPAPKHRPQREATPRAPKAVQEPPRHKPHYWVLTAALSMAAVSGGYSIFGMASIFTGAAVPVIAMGVALEYGKLTAVAWLGKGLGGRGLRAALVGLVAVLMLLNAIGAFGFLSRAHIAQELAGQLTVASADADVNVRVKLAHDAVSDLNKQIAQIDDAVAAATKRGRANSAVDLANAQRKARAGLVAERVKAGEALAKLQVEAAAVEGQKAVNAADLGPVLYLAEVLHVPAADMLRWFILLIALLLDPAAVLLLMAATTHRTAINPRRL